MPEPFGNAADMAGFAAAGKCNSCRLFYGIRGHDGIVGRLRSSCRCFQLGSDFIHMCFNRLNVQSLTNDAGGADEYLVLIHTAAFAAAAAMRLAFSMPSGAQALALPEFATIA